MKTPDWSKTNKKCPKCNHSLYRCNIPTRYYALGELVCPTHGQQEG